jgi:hypothetical protein
MLRPASFAAVMAVALAFAGIASAQQLGYNFNFTLPIVAETQSYHSTIYVHNPKLATLTVTFTYIGATTSATPGTSTCGPLDVAPGNTVKTSLTALCPALNVGSNFGVLMSAFTGGGGTYALYSRVQTPEGNGFSIEGMVANTCCGTVSEVIGLVRQAAPPTFQSNCFISNQEPRAGRIVLTLASGDGQVIASQIIDVKAMEFIRLLDVFATLNAPSGDLDNVRATFESIVPVGGGAPVLFVASCTVQNNTSFDADFRIAKFHF